MRLKNHLKRIKRTQRNRERVSPLSIIYKGVTKLAIVTLEETKQYLRVDGDDEDALITSLITAAEEYLKNATGIQFDDTNSLAKLFCWVLVTDWYENREYTFTGKVSEKVRPIIESMLTQLKYCYESFEEAQEG